MTTTTATLVGRKEKPYNIKNKTNIILIVFIIILVFGLLLFYKFYNK